MSRPSTASAAPSGDELANVALLQHETLKAQLQEFHQQVELYVQLTGEHPFSSEDAVAKHDALPLREPTTLTASACPTLVSEFTRSWASQWCSEDSALQDASAVTGLLHLVENGARSADDRAQVVFALDVTLSKERDMSAPMSATFETRKGFEMLATWFTQDCSAQDEVHKALSQMLLKFLQFHRPAKKFPRKVVLNMLLTAQRDAHGPQTKTLLKQVIEEYRK